MTKAEIQLVRSLADKRARDEQGLFVAEGEKLIAEIRASGWRIRKIFALEGLFEGEAVETLSRKELERVSLLKTPSKAVAIVEIPRHTLHIEQLKGQLALVLDEVQNPGNLGTIIRIADWFGLTDIVCSPDSADCFNPKVVQATMGAILRVRVHYTPLEPFLEAAAKAGIPRYGTFLEGENIYDSELSAEGLIIMGNEGRGISATVEQRISHKLFIPPYPADCPTSESLNVAMATGIVCAEFRRRLLKQ